VSRKFDLRVCTVGSVEDDGVAPCGDGTSRRSVDDRSRHSDDVQLHLAPALPAASDAQQLGDGRRLPVGGDGLPALAHPPRRAVRPHATVGDRPCDHMRLLLPQKTRERLERDVAERKTRTCLRIPRDPYHVTSYHVTSYHVTRTM